MKNYAIIIEKGETSYGISAPDFPGCVAVAETLDEAKKLFKEALEFHIKGLIEDGLPVPEPTIQSDYVSVEAA
jgi:predicted RNase H-like HicB family nuclease